MDAASVHIPTFYNTPHTHSATHMSSRWMWPQHLSPPLTQSHLHTHRNTSSAVECSLTQSSCPPLRPSLPPSGAACGRWTMRPTPSSPPSRIRGRRLNWPEHPSTDGSSTERSTDDLATDGSNDGLRVHLLVCLSASTTREQI